MLGNTLNVLAAAALATLYGPHTKATLESPSAACRFPRSCLTRMVRARRAISTDDWDTAADAVHQAALKLGFPFRGKCCTGRPWPAPRPRWISPPSTPNSPTPSGDMPAVHAFAGHLPTEPAAVLATPCTEPADARSPSLTEPAPSYRRHGQAVCRQMVSWACSGGHFASVTAAAALRKNQQRRGTYPANAPAD